MLFFMRQQLASRFYWQNVFSVGRWIELNSCGITLFRDFEAIHFPIITECPSKYLKGSGGVIVSSCGYRTRVWPDLITYNTAISACSKGQWQIALLLLEDLIGKEVVDCVSYNSAVSACCGGSQWEIAFHILQMMTLNHVLPDSITLHVLIMSFE